ncbi:MAG: glycosyltransferase [Bacteroidales bacterium]|nr:glycosyltransferase [Bacteroidales bacterium]
MIEPLLSIITITYNQEQFIAKTIESVLMQKVDFPIEYIIAEDCSTDGTLAICKDYAEKYPDIIRIITSEKNVGGIENERRAMLAAKGKYVALCEGDDYWTDPLKLQRQVGFLESHPDYSVTFHRYKIHYLNDDRWVNDDIGCLFEGKDVEGVEINTYMFLHRWITQHLTMVYRKSAFDTNLIDRYKYYRDSHLIYHLLEAGKGYIFAFDGGVYNKTGDGIYSKLSMYDTQKVQIAVFEELWKQNNDNRVREMYAMNIRYLIETSKHDKEHKRELAKYAWKLFKTDKKIKPLFKLFLEFYKIDEKGYNCKK